MLSDFLERASTFAEKLSERERRLAGAALMLVPLFVFLSLGKAAYSHVQRLDERIEQLSQTIIEYNQNIAQTKSVNDQFKTIAAQHSSSWTEAQIQDRLKMELLRLAEKLPPPLKEDGTPAATQNIAFGKLVQTPQLSKGELRDSGEGYKEYHLSVNVPSTEFYDLISYMERLQDSPQMLRIQSMLISRTATETKAKLDLDIVRTVVIGSIKVPEQVSTVIDTPPIEWELAAWKAGNCATALAKTPLAGAPKTLEALAEAPNASVYLEQAVTAGVTYNFAVDIQSDGPGRLGIQAAGADTPFAGEQMLPANGKAYRYHLQFTAPGEAGSQVSLRLPMVTLESGGAKVLVENVLLQPVED